MFFTTLYITYIMKYAAYFHDYAVYLNFPIKIVYLNVYIRIYPN